MTNRMFVSIPIQNARRTLQEGGVIAYPTEGLFGLGCLPSDTAAVSRVLAIKKRDPSMGLILLASTQEQILSWGQLPPGVNLGSSLQHPVTWLIPAEPWVPYCIRGNHDTIAVRITLHPVPAALCDAIGSPLVSTSANLSGRPPVRNAFLLRRQFGQLVDYIVPGDCGPARGASEIRDLASGRILRAADT